ncbi:uncharacterized protein PHACADRAFT_193482 [Phanerochaete carnosa HHB-10118-sp]|uniref:Heterokaryon incompatibility domain-containing protein n=1 Tax=Phanerochaete carnosa (strain HHB-10118-sp) TaxID=650164 RepID=K5WH06_PHACS|nr:uncharacterized protein PHACADRAFT_193482 [Phanerochaete carnosa HHB-10118-sp]EKM58364.1 hypothetical protein PHACADRAFT_193482 [Phanerochaete carnosa HHB-10118-sp]
MTPINGHRWLVPIPRGISLDHVWLDVACLWWEGKKVDDQARLEEWKLDVPTIGHIYQAKPDGRPCITYFNGLGLPFDPSPTVVESDRHWFNRVWTVQETLFGWLPGGLSAAPHPDGPKFFSRLRDLPQSLRGFDASASLESAWMLLIKHMNGWQRLALLIQYQSDVPFGLFVSWAEFLRLTFRPTPDYWMELDLVDPLEVRSNKPGQYHNDPPATEPYYIGSLLADMHQGSGPQAPQLRLYDRADPITVQVSATETYGCLVPNVPCRILDLGDWSELWAAVEAVGERDLRGERALEMIKWGVIEVDRSEHEKFVELGPWNEGTRVIYLSSGEALARSGYVDKYMEAFNKARKSRKAENRS